MLSHEVASNISSYNYWTDVTALVRPKLDGAATGDVFFAIGEPDLFRVDGAVLAVVFDDPNVATTKSVALLFGALKTVGDQFTVGLEQPFTSTSQLEMSLGISFGFQPSTQYSTVSVNNQLITSAAGGQDDGIGANGSLITVGGVGDSPTNPANPNAAATSARSDDELYDLRPFVPLLTKNVVVKTSNPSNDDNIFLAAFVSDPPITTIATDSAPDWAAWSVGDVHAHASGDTSLLIHPACGGQTNPIGETACATKMVNDISLRAGRFGTDWLIFTEHAPWLGFLRQGQLGIYGKEQGERQWNAIVAAATGANGANGLSMLSGLELGTAAPACMHVTGASFNWLPFYERDAPLFDSPGHFGVYKTPTFIDNSIFDCNETGVNSYALDVASGWIWRGESSRKQRSGQPMALLEHRPKPSELASSCRPRGPAGPRWSQDLFGRHRRLRTIWADWHNRCWWASIVPNNGNC